MEEKTEAEFLTEEEKRERGGRMRIIHKGQNIDVVQHPEDLAAFKDVGMVLKPIVPLSKMADVVLHGASGVAPYRFVVVMGELHPAEGTAPARVTVMDAEMLAKQKEGFDVKPVYLSIWPDHAGFDDLPIDVGEAYQIKVLSHVRVVKWNDVLSLRADNLTSVEDPEAYVNDPTVSAAVSELEAAAALVEEQQAAAEVQQSAAVGGEKLATAEG